MIAATAHDPLTLLLMLCSFGPCSSFVKGDSHELDFSREPLGCFDVGR